MASYQRISEDVIRQVITVEEKEALQKYHKMQKGILEMRDSVKELEKERDKYERGSQKWKEITKDISDQKKQIKAEESELRKLRDTLSVNCMTMTQLKKLARDLTREMDNMSAAANPEEYAALSQRLADVKNRMKDLTIQTQYLKDSQEGVQVKSFLEGTAIAKIAEWSIGGIKDLISGIHDLADEGVEMARAADGITKAFNELNNPGLLDNLREATKGTVNDVELMKAAVQANDFRIPLDNLGKLLSFAQLKAQQTGQSVEYMTQSIVTGLGRKSVMILDNLGLSAAEINEELSKTGDFAQAVATIIDKQLAKAGETYVSAADRAAQRTVALQNAQKELGDALLPLKEEYEDAYGSIQMGIIDIIKWMVKYRDGVKMVMAAVLLYVAATKAASIETETLNKIMKRSVWGLVATAIAVTVGYVISLVEQSKAARKAAEELNDVESQAITTYTEEAAKIKALDKAMRDERLSIDERKKALNELKTIIPGYNGMLSEEGQLTRDNKKAIDDYLVSLQKEIQMKAYRDKLEELYKRKMQQEEARDDASKKYWDTRQNNTLSGYDRNAFTSKVLRFFGAEEEANMKENLNKAENDLADTSGKIEQLLQKIGTDSQEMSKAASTDPSTAEHDRKYWQEQFDLRKKAFEATKKGSKEAAAALKELKEAEDKLAEYNTYSSGKSGKSTKSDKTDRQEDKDAMKLQGEARQKLLDQERFFNEASVRSYKKQLAEKKISQSQFEAMQLSLQVAHADRMVNIEKEQMETIRTMTFKDAKQKEIAIAEQQRNIEKAENDAYNARTAAYQNFQKNMEQLETSGMNATQREEYTYQLQMKTLEGTYQASVAYAREHNQSLLEIDEAYQTAKEKLETDHTQKLEERKLQVRKQYQLATQGELMQADMDALLRQYDEGLISLEDYYKARESIEQEYEDRKQQVRQQYGLVTKAEEYQAQMDQLKQYLDQELLTTEEYEKAKKQLRMQNLKESFDYWQNQVSTAVSALQDAEMAQVDAKYDAEIAAAKKAGKDTTQLEAKKEEEKLKIQKKYADVNFAVKCAEIVSNTAVSIMKALAELGPIAGPIAAGLMAVTGAAQLAIAKAERDRVKNMTAGSASSSTEAVARVATGREDGGYMPDDDHEDYIDVVRRQDGKRFRAKNEPDRRGYVDRPTVIVGEGPAGRSKEWVASNAAVENPTVRPVIDTIDQAQRAGTVRTLDLRKVLLQRGLQSGGYVDSTLHPSPSTLHPSPVTPNPSPSTFHQSPSTLNPSPVTEDTLSRLADVLDRMEQNGIPAIVGLDQIDASQQLRDQSRKIASK